MLFIGIDIIEISRIEGAIAGWGDKFLYRVYTEREIEMYGEKLQSLAARFAAKEAVIKAIDAAGRGISFKDIEILTGPGGKPFVQLHGSAQKLAKPLGIIRFNVSLSHSRCYAVAMVMGETAT
jgi:holo-[acyl-carrier protein] synthase